jgi:hypothetical protein
VQERGGYVNYNTLDDGIQIMEELARELTGGNVASPQTSPQASPLGIDTGALQAVAEAEGAKAEAAKAKTAASESRRSGGRQSGGAVFGYGLLNLAVGLGSFVQGDPGGGVITLLSYGAAAGLVYWEMTLAYEDDLAGIPGTVGLGVAGFALLYGFIRPAVFNSSRALAEIADGINVSAAPEGRVLLSYTLKF